MKKPLLALFCALTLLISCTEETPRAELLDRVFTTGTN